MAFCVEMDSRGVDCGAGVERKRGAVVEMGRRRAGGEERMGRDEDISLVLSFSSMSSSSSPSSASISSSKRVCEVVDRRRRFELRSSIL